MHESGKNDYVQATQQYLVTLGVGTTRPTRICALQPSAVATGANGRNHGNFH